MTGPSYDVSRNVNCSGRPLTSSADEHCENGSGRRPRRDVLRAVGAAGAGLLAGCTTGSTDGSPAESSDAEGDGAGDPGGENDAGGSDSETIDAGSSVRLVDLEAPARVERGEAFTVDAVAENATDERASLTTTLVDRGRPIESIELDLPPESRERWESGPIVREEIPDQGRLELGVEGFDRSRFVEVYEPLALGERHVYADGVSVAVDAVVLVDEFAYDLPDREGSRSAPDGRQFLFLYVTVDWSGEGEWLDAPRRRAISIRAGDRVYRPFSPSHPPSAEQISELRARQAKRGRSFALASGNPEYDPVAVEATVNGDHPDERVLGDLPEIHAGESSWFLYEVPERVRVSGVTALVSR